MATRANPACSPGFPFLQLVISARPSEPQFAAVPTNVKNTIKPISIAATPLQISVRTTRQC
jgi:hypothetical protein